MKTDRKNITQPADWWAAFARQAQSEGLTLSAWAGECMRANLDKNTAAGLSERPAANRPVNKRDTDNDN